MSVSVRDFTNFAEFQIPNSSGTPAAWRYGTFDTSLQSWVDVPDRELNCVTS